MTQIKIIRMAIEKFGRLDILVNNAGILRDRMVYNTSDEDWDIVLKVHLYGHFYCTRPACACTGKDNFQGGKLDSRRTFQHLPPNPGCGAGQPCATGSNQVKLINKTLAID